MTNTNEILSSESLGELQLSSESTIPFAKVMKESTPAPAKQSGKQYKILSTYISANPGVTRTVILADAGLLAAIRTPASVALIAAGDKAETIRWKRRLNFLIRDMRRAGVDIRIQRIDGSACYTILGTSIRANASLDTTKEKESSLFLGGTTKELPFSKPVPRSFGGVNVVKEDLAPASFIAIDIKRMDEPQDVTMNFDDLLAQLDGIISDCTSAES